MKAWICVLLSCTILAAGAPPKVEEEVLAAMDAWRQATIKRDGAALEKLLHPDLTYSHSDGELQNKAEVIRTVTTGKASAVAIEFSLTTVRIYGKTALVRGVADLTYNTGATITKSHYNVLHVWLKGPQGWQMVARQATKLPKPV